MNWNNIIPVNNSQNNAFEELVCQLAYKKNFKNKDNFIRVGNPDAGVECYIVLENGDEIGFQAKYFTNAVGKSQWEQLDISLKTALEKHPKLTKYYVAIPQDRSDPRNGRKYFMVKWNEWVEKWQNEAQEKYGKDLEIAYWGSHELITMLGEDRNSGMKKFFFNEIDLSNKWFKNQNKNSILNLGVRYSPAINVNIEYLNTYFEALNLNSTVIKELKIIYHKFNKTFSILKDIPDSLNCLVDDFKDIISKEIDLNKMANILNKMQDEIFNNNLVKIISTTDGSNMDKFQDTIYEFFNFIRENKNFLNVHKNPFIILKGKAGVGKSHLLADIINNRSANSLFLLGQHFKEAREPWNQILELLHIKNCNKDEFLDALNSKAMVDNERIIIFIDAINEGRGKDFWNDYLNGFIEDIKKYEYLGLVLSIRSEYYKYIIPEVFVSGNKIKTIEHNGFDRYDASEIFFKHYNIRPNIPILAEEFLNPLFLKMFCEGFSQDKSYVNKLNFHFIIKFYIEDLENRLRKKHPKYPRNISLIDEGISALMPMFIKENSKLIKYKDAFVVLRNELLKYIDFLDESFLDIFVSEGIFSKTMLESKSDEYIYFSYEKLYDYFASIYILKPFKTKDDLQKDFNSKVFLPFINGENRYRNKGIIQILSIIIPEQFDGVELFELVEIIEQIKSEEVILDCFLEGLMWRNSSSIKEKTIQRILKNISNFAFQKAIFQMLFSCATILEHPFNANFLFDYLSKFSMKERDKFFIPLLNKLYLAGDFNFIERLINWAWLDRDKSHINKEVLFLTSIALSWCLTSSNRELRDKATKATISLLDENAQLVLKLLYKFKEIDDLYIHERLFAIAYGVVIRSQSNVYFKKLGEYVYDVVFKKDETYPHVLIRDYAKNLIEHILNIGIQLDINKNDINPPYKSYFPDISSLPKDNYVEQYEEKSIYNTFIISSMTTNIGSQKVCYGDFGRYIFESALYDFECYEYAQLISNYAAKQIFEKYGYDGEYFNEAEKSITNITNIQKANRYDLDRYSHKIERIGKKYQWIAFYETMARITDNFQMKNSAKYNGAFEPFMRNIDPTVLLTNYKKHQLHDNWWSLKRDITWDEDNKKWLEQEEDDWLKFDEYLNMTDNNGNEWLTLCIDKKLKKSTKKGEEKKITYFVRSYLIKNDSFNKFKNAFENANDAISSFPDDHLHCYKIYDKECYSSTAYNLLKDECEFEEINLRGVNLKVYPTTIEYSWESEFDASKEGTIQILKPSKLIYDGLHMKYSKKDFYFIDENNDFVCFDPSSGYETDSSLLVRKDKIAEFLNKNNLKLIYVFNCEKNIYLPYEYRLLGKLDYFGYGLVEDNGSFKIEMMDKNDG